MKRALLVMLVALTAGLMAAPSAPAKRDMLCAGTLPAGVYGNLVVPKGGGCTLSDSLVRGNVKVREDGVFLSLNNDVRGNVKGDRGSVIELTQTRVDGHVESSSGNHLFLGPGAPGNEIDGNVKGNKTPVTILGGQSIDGNVSVSKAIAFTLVDSNIEGNVDVMKVSFVSLSGPRVDGDVELKKSDGQVQICGLHVDDGDLVVEKFEGDHLFVLGEPACPPLVIADGDLKVVDNTPTIGLRVDGAQVAENLQVKKTRGGGFKAVQNNVVGDTLQCSRNETPFVGGPNTAQQAQGQCF
jgi:hypothetical protein